MNGFHNFYLKIMSFKLYINTDMPTCIFLTINIMIVLILSHKIDKIYIINFFFFSLNKRSTISTMDKCISDQTFMLENI